MKPLFELRRTDAGADETPLKRIVIRENIVRRQRKLAEEKGAERPNGQTQRVLQQLLTEEETKLAILDRKVAAEARS